MIGNRQYIWRGPIETVICPLTERARNSILNDQREMTLKIYKAELWFLCMTNRLIVLYNCMKFHLNSFNGCQLTKRSRNSIAND